MNNQETLERIEAALWRIVSRISNHEQREAWMLAGFRPSDGDTWRNDQGAAVSYRQVLTTSPDVARSSVMVRSPANIVAQSMLWIGTLTALLDEGKARDEYGEIELAVRRLLEALSRQHRGGE